MKLKPTEILILLLALIVGAAAIFFQSIESTTTKHSEPTSASTLAAPSTFFTEQQTVESSTLDSIDPTQANQTVTDFFNTLTLLLNEEPETTMLIQAKNSLSQKNSADISDDLQVGSKELSRFSGLLTAPQSVTQLRTEQLSSEKIDITVIVTTTSGQAAEKTVTLINEENQWKIDNITTME